MFVAGLRVLMVALELVRRAVSQRRMQPSRVVPALDLGEQRRVCLRLARPVVPRDQLAFQRGEETPGHGVIVGDAHRAHGRAHGHLGLPVGHAGVLTALIAVVDHRFGLARVQRHGQRRNHQRGRHLLAYGPADHLAAESIEHDGPGI